MSLGGQNATPTLQRGARQSVFAGLGRHRHREKARLLSLAHTVPQQQRRTHSSPTASLRLRRDSSLRSTLLKNSRLSFIRTSAKQRRLSLTRCARARWAKQRRQSLRVSTRSRRGATPYRGGNSKSALSFFGESTRWAANLLPRFETKSSMSCDFPSARSAFTSSGVISCSQSFFVSLKTA